MLGRAGLKPSPIGCTSPRSAVSEDGSSVERRKSAVARWVVPGLSCGVQHRGGSHHPPTDCVSEGPLWTNCTLGSLLDGCGLVWKARKQPETRAGRGSPCFQTSQSNHITSLPPLSLSQSPTTPGKMTPGRWGRPGPVGPVLVLPTGGGCQPSSWSRAAAGSIRTSSGFPD